MKVVIVSDSFEGKTLIDQHKMVNEVLKTELATGVHALSIKTVTKKKWEASGQNITHQTPNCLGGSKHDQKK
jgi:BolA protein